MTIPYLNKCGVCNHPERFAIQKEIDNEVFIDNIVLKYHIELRDVKQHIKNNHREILMEYGKINSDIKKNNPDVGLTLAEYIELWQIGFKQRNPGNIKDSDAIRAMELYMKLQGSIINKHEVKITRTVEEALKSFLMEDEDKNETEYTEKEETKNETIKTDKASKSD